MTNDEWAGQQVKKLHAFTAKLAWCALIFVFFAVGFVWSLQDELLPDAGDCAARRQSADCWKGAVR